MTYKTLEDYEKILSEIPYSIIEDHLRRRKEEVDDFMNWGWVESKKRSEESK
jgi:hypothetical protein